MKVENFDQFYEYERRQHEIYNISLGTRGFPLRGLAYFGVLFLVNFVALSWLGIGAMLMGWGLSGIVPLGLLFLGLPAGLAFVGVQQMPGGLPAHKMIGPAITHLTAERTLFGWVPVRDLGRRWSPPELVVEPGIDDRKTPRARLTGPADLLIGNDYELVKAPRSVLAVRDRPAATVLVAPQRRAAGARGMSIPDGVTVDIRGVAR